MSKDMCSTIDLFLTKRQQLMSAMATLDKDKDSRQEQRRNILLAITGIYSSRIRLQEGEEKNQAEEKNERLLINDEAYCRGEVV